MAILQVILSAVLITSIAADDSCPGASEITPCTCDGEGVNCMRLKTLDQLRSAFKANFKYGGVRGVWIQNTPITTLPKDVFGSIQSQQFYVEMNSISSVDIQAFSASKGILRVLSLFGNKFNTLAYSDFSQFQKLGVLNLGRNEITSIPDSAFSSKTIGTIILAQNKIAKIGKNAFYNLPSLVKLDISYNLLTTLGPMSFAITPSHHPGLQVLMIRNQISNVDSTAFQDTAPYALILPMNRLTSLPPKSFGQLFQKIGQKGGSVDVSHNPFSCKSCEDNYWILQNQAVLHQMVIGFACSTSGKTIRDLRKEDIGC